MTKVYKFLEEKFHTKRFSGDGRMLFWSVVLGLSIVMPAVVDMLTIPDYLIVILAVINLTLFVTGFNIVTERFKDKK